MTRAPWSSLRVRLIAAAAVGLCLGLALLAWLLISVYRDSVVRGFDERLKSYARWNKSLASFLYRNRTMTLWKCAELRETSRPRESEGDFRVRLGQVLRERSVGFCDHILSSEGFAKQLGYKTGNALRRADTLTCPFALFCNGGAGGDTAQSSTRAGVLLESPD